MTSENAAGWEECRAQHPDLLPDFPPTPSGAAMRELYEEGCLEVTDAVRPGAGGRPQRCFRITEKGEQQAEAARRRN